MSETATPLGARCRAPRARPVARQPRIGELHHIPTRYMRSVYLERDFDDIASLRHYVVTPAMVAVFSRMLEGLRPASGHRAWRITGDYGTGKSSFALVLAHLLRDPEAAQLVHLRKAIEREAEDGTLDEEIIQLVPVLVTGAREPLVPTVAQPRSVGRWTLWLGVGDRPTL